MSQKPAPRNPDTLPTSGDPSGKCPRCGRICGFSEVRVEPLAIRLVVGQTPTAPERVTVEQVTVLECQGCRRKVMVVEVRDKETSELAGVLWWPTDHLGDLERVAGVPRDIVTAYSEGVRCLAVQAPNAAVALFRTAIAQIVEEKGSATAKAEKDLFKRIEQMVQEKTLWDNFGTWAHHVRSTGNAGAHGEKFDPVTIEQAIELQRFIRELINFLYELRHRRPTRRPRPHHFHARRQRRRDPLRVGAAIRSEAAMENRRHSRGTQI